MPTFVADVEVEVGNCPFLEGVVRRDSNGKQPFDLSIPGTFAFFYVKDSEQTRDSDAIVTYDLSAGVEFPDPGSGHFQIRADGRSTKASGEFFYLFVVVWCGHTYEVAKGAWIVR